jgi:hypothetical protein
VFSWLATDLKAEEMALPAPVLNLSGLAEK